MEGVNACTLVSSTIILFTIYSSLNKYLQRNYFVSGTALATGNTAIDKDQNPSMHSIEEIHIYTHTHTYIHTYTHIHTCYTFLRKVKLKRRVGSSLRSER